MGKVGRGAATSPERRPYLTAFTKTPQPPPPPGLTRFDLGVGLGVSALVHLTTVAFLAPRFTTNDDPTMLSIASGQAYGEPSENLVFFNVIFGFILKGLYSLAPGLPWYGLLLYGLQAAAIGVLIGCSLPAKRSMHPLTVVTLVSVLATIVCLVGLDLAVNIHFTAVGVLLGGAGLLLTLHIAHDQTVRIRMISLAVALIGASHLMRPDALLAAGVLMAPIFVVHLIRARRVGAPVRAIAVLSLIVVGIGFGAEQVRYRDEEWTAFRSFDEVRGELNGTPRLAIDDELEVVLAQIGWSWTDRSMLDAFFITNKTVFDEASLRTLLEERRDVVRPIGARAAADSAYSTFRIIWFAVASAVAGVLFLRSRVTAAIALAWPGLAGCSS